MEARPYGSADFRRGYGWPTAVTFGFAIAKPAFCDGGAKSRRRAKSGTSSSAEPDEVIGLRPPLFFPLEKTRLDLIHRRLIQAKLFPRRLSSQKIMPDKFIVRHYSMSQKNQSGKKIPDNPEREKEHLSDGIENSPDNTAGMSSHFFGLLRRDRCRIAADQTIIRGRCRHGRGFALACAA